MGAPLKRGRDVERFARRASKMRHVKCDVRTGTLSEELDSGTSSSEMRSQRARDMESSLATASGIKAPSEAVLTYRISFDLGAEQVPDICAYTRGCGANSPARLGVALYIRLASVIIARRSDADNVTARARALLNPRTNPPGG